MGRVTTALFAACALWFSVLSPKAQGQATVPAYTFVDLGTAYGMPTLATGINNAGQITGETSDGVNFHAFRITPVLSNGTLTWFQGNGGINSLMALATTDSIHPYVNYSIGINSQGDLAGTAQGGIETGPQNAFYWPASTLSGLELSSKTSLAFGINDNGSVIGTGPTIWRLVNGKFKATTIPASAEYSPGNPSGLNNLDQVVGTFTSSSGSQQLYIWLPEAAYGLPAGTNFLPNLGSAVGINDTGTIIGTYSGQAAVWTPTRNGTGFAMTALAAFAFPVGLNNPTVAGQTLTIVGSCGSAFTSHACVWNAVNSFYDLNVLTVNPPPQGLFEAYGVNNSGLIVGVYMLGPNINTFSGYQLPSRSFLLVPNATLPAAATAPAPPTGLSAVLGASQVTLSWTAGSSNQNGFEVGREQVSLADRQIGSVGATSFTDQFTDVPYLPANSYVYGVNAFNVAGYSAVTSVSVITPGAPLAPSSVTAAATSSTSIRLGWTNNSNTQDSLTIQRSTDGVTFTTLTTVTPGTATTYTDTTAVASKAYYYCISAHSTNGLSSAYSAVVKATTPKK